MSAPAISIILPVYNSAVFVAKTIDSLLAQTFLDFELLIIDDGSTDNTRDIIHSYTDDRIVVIKNEINQGLVFTLNKGIHLAKGRYVARMDADDIALPQRLELQAQWLDSRPGTALVASTVVFINEKEQPTGSWPLDQVTTTASTIKLQMPWSNCIAHPSIMIRRTIAAQYQYKHYQQHTEDYDLWLRLLADGLVLEKIAQDLLWYRVHEYSITGSVLRKRNPFLQQFHCKQRFLRARAKAGKWGTFENKVLLTTLYDGTMGIGKLIKNHFRG